jgi:hypothetical protein
LACVATTYLESNRRNEGAAAFPFTENGGMRPTLVVTTTVLELDRPSSGVSTLIWSVEQTGLVAALQKK